MITAAQLRKAAQLVARGWTQRAAMRRNPTRYCPMGAILQLHAATIEVDWFDRVIPHNDADDCTQDAAVMFLLLCAEAREHGDL